MRDRVKFIEAARREYQTDDCEIDDNAQLSEVNDGTPGAWVQAWVWVSDEEV